MTETTDIKALREAALKATKGRWVAFTDDSSKTYAVHTPNDKRCEDVIKWAGFDCQKSAKANAEFIALANPATIIALLDELEAERQRTLEMTEQYLDRNSALTSATLSYEKADVELAALRGAQELVADVVRDANRYRFLRDEDAWGEDSDSWDAETRTGLISYENLLWLSTGHFDAAIDARMEASDIPFFNPVSEPFTNPPKPVVVLSDCDIAAVSHMAHWYTEEQCEAWVAGVEHAKKQMLAAGIVVKDGE